MFSPPEQLQKRPRVDGALRLNGCLSSHQSKVWWECGKEETHCEKAYYLKRCLKNICACSLHGGNGVNEWMWQLGERSVLAKRGRGWICSVWKTAAKQLSPQPVDGNLMSRLASLLLSLPTIPLLFLLLDHPSIFASLQKHIRGRHPEKQRSAPSSLAADKLCSVQLDGQSSQLLSVAGKSQATSVWFGRKGKDKKTFNGTHTHTQLNTCFSERPEWTKGSFGCFWLSSIIFNEMYVPLFADDVSLFFANPELCSSTLVWLLNGTT